MASACLEEMDSLALGFDVADTAVVPFIHHVDLVRRLKEAATDNKINKNPKTK